MMGLRCGFRRMAASAVVGTLLAGGLAAQVLAEEGASFPRIGCVYGIALHPDDDAGTYFNGAPLTAEQIARYDLILGVYGPWEDESSGPALRERLARLRQANPNVVIIGQQVQVESAYADPAAAPKVLPWRKPPDDGWLTGVDGKRLPGGRTGTFLLNLRQESVLEWLTERCVAEVQERGYDGVLLGAMGPNFPDWTLSRIAPGYTVDADGDTIADDLEDLHFLWQDAKRQLCADVRDRLGHDVVIVAGGSPQNDYIWENFNGWSTGTPLLELRRGNARWEYELGRYITWTEAPHSPHTTLWISVPDSTAPPESADDLKERMRFGLAATLMGDGYFAFVVQGREEGWFPEFDVPLGQPLGPALMHTGGAWHRKFEGGVAVVNPTAQPAPYALDAEHRDISTGATGTEFTIQPKDGRILVPVR